MCLRFGRSTEAICERGHRQRDRAEGSRDRCSWVILLIVCERLARVVIPPISRSGAEVLGFSIARAASRLGFACLAGRECKRDLEPVGRGIIYLHVLVCKRSPTPLVRESANSPRFGRLREKRMEGIPRTAPVRIEENPSFSSTRMDAALSGWVNAPSDSIPSLANAVEIQAEAAWVARPLPQNGRANLKPRSIQSRSSKTRRPASPTGLPESRSMTIHLLKPCRS